MAEDLLNLKQRDNSYTEEHIQTLSWNEHIRRRPGMYIGKLGDGKAADDGIYVLVKEVVDNSVDEFNAAQTKASKNIIVNIEDNKVTVRDFGRGIPLAKVVDCASVMNTGGKFDSKVFKRSVGLNGVGIKAVNALSTYFHIQSFKDAESVSAVFDRGNLVSKEQISTKEKNGTLIEFIADDEKFQGYSYNFEFIETLFRNYSYLNPGLCITFNGKEFKSQNGLLDLLSENVSETPLYDPIHLKGEDVEVVITHGDGYGETIFSFVNGQNTTQGGTHLMAFREGVAKTLKEFFKKDFDYSDARQSLIGIISVKVEEPVFESQTKTKLGSKEMYKDGPSVRNYINDFIKTELDNYLHKNLDIADTILKKILASKKEREAISNIGKAGKERAKRTLLNNKKLRDCSIHYGDKNSRADESTLFITEGLSASGSITSSRDADVQAVFSLRGKPSNSYKESKQIIYKNEELNLLTAALNIEDDIANLRYNKVVIATDADVDGMHIRLLMLTFFLKFFPDLIKLGHLYILQTPLFRVKSKNRNIYCYNIAERDMAMAEIGKGAEVTRFKGLGEISPEEFKDFIGNQMKLEEVKISSDDSIADLLSFYMGKNTNYRCDFIKDNLREDINNTEDNL